MEACGTRPTADRAARSRRPSSADHAQLYRDIGFEIREDLDEHLHRLRVRVERLALVAPFRSVHVVGRDAHECDPPRGRKSCDIGRPTDTRDDDGARPPRPIAFSGAQALIRSTAA
jgi:hypothetical protein